MTSRLLKHVHGRFEIDLMALRNKCSNLRRRVASESPGEGTWAQFSKLQVDSWQLLKECLAFLEGVVIREAGIDGGVCDLADAMLYKLAEKTDMRWQRFTLVAAGEYFSTISGIIRLRYTDTDIWNLPVAAHEFGHFVSSTDAFSEFDSIVAVERRKDPRFESHLKELFSDLFATFTLGPSFVMNCVLLRFCPTGASQQSQTHPSFTERVWWMLETLAKMDETEGNRTYRTLCAAIEQAWATTLNAAGESETLGGEDMSRLRGWLAELYDLVESRIPAVRYRGLLRSAEHLHALRNGQTPRVTQSTEIADILNAAWWYRLGSPAPTIYQLDQVADKAIAICEEISKW
jgi:hypothetical protein